LPSLPSRIGAGVRGVELDGERRARSDALVDGGAVLGAGSLDHLEAATIVEGEDLGH